MEGAEPPRPEGILTPPIERGALKEPPLLPRGAEMRGAEDPPLGME
jgi:hypothetical protein